MKLETHKLSIPKPSEELFVYLSNVENYAHIMPDGVQRFEVLSESSFLFQLKGMPVIQLAIKEKNEFTDIVLVADAGKFPFLLKACFEVMDKDKTEFQMKFEGEFNAMMAMMIKNPILNFIQSLSENFHKIMSS